MKLVPYKRIGEPDDIGRAAVWLASDYSDYINDICPLRRWRHDLVSGLRDQRLRPRGRHNLQQSDAEKRTRNHGGEGGAQGNDGGASPTRGSRARQGEMAVLGTLPERTPVGNGARGL